MLRLHFTFEDLSKIVVSCSPPPMSEAVLALQILTQPGQQSRFGSWRASLRGRIPATVRPLREVVPTRGWIPDFLTPVLRGPATHADALEAVRSTSPRQLRADLTRLPTTRPPAWIRNLAAGDTDAMTTITDALAAWNQLAITPHERRIQATLDTHTSRQASLLAGQGVDALLRQLHPALTWQPPVLNVPSPVDADIDLAGRGLILAPMLFCGPTPRLRLPDDAGNRPVLAYPLPIDPTNHPLTDLPSDRQHRDTAALDRLLGGTRATVLRAIATAPGLTTAELAHRADIALATASEHATVLRETGLITSHRDGTRVRHFPTTTATTLLRPPAPN